MAQTELRSLEALLVWGDRRTLACAFHRIRGAAVWVSRPTRSCWWLTWRQHWVRAGGWVRWSGVMCAALLKTRPMSPLRVTETLAGGPAADPL